MTIEEVIAAMQDARPENEQTMFGSLNEVRRK